jgi:hypothetical protein
MTVAGAARMKLHAHAVASMSLLLAGCSVHVAKEPAGPPVFDELEPNDSAYTAPFFGGVRPGDAFTILGHVTDDGPDLYDGFALRADEPCAIAFELVSHSPYTDLDVCVFDPDLGEFVVCADGPSDPEHGSVVILEPGKVVHLVVTSAYGDTGYELRVAGESVSGYPLHAAQAPGALGPSNDTTKAAVRRGYAAAKDSGADRALPRVPVLLYDLETGRSVRATARVEGDELGDVELAR